MYIKEKAFKSSLRALGDTAGGLPEDGAKKEKEEVRGSIVYDMIF